MKQGGKRPGAGRPKSEATSLINFRIEAKKKSELKERYGRSLNKMFAEWVDNLLK